MSTKICCTCKIEKELSCFGKSKNTKDGLKPRCKDCRKIEGIEYNKKYPEKRKENNRKYEAKPETKLARRKNVLKSKYKLTNIELERVLEARKGKCEICGNYEYHKFKGGSQALSVDHNHITGMVRGLICANCNHALGMVKDNTEILKKMIDYLNKYNESPVLEINDWLTYRFNRRM